ncbi:hypothetical protein CXB51_010589 [Gossypium anomalum]|uniref:Uncharacterized protein n=1 Tax=Gossypium anomalum TaxID=47600 RepID=A0A8J6D327_9ROSI|nr:hypothetical protein CXB51_010589 [Gossypium anomalum]
MATETLDDEKPEEEEVIDKENEEGSENGRGTQLKDIPNGKSLVSPNPIANWGLLVLYC